MTTHCFKQRRCSWRSSHKDLKVATCPSDRFHNDGYMRAEKIEAVNNLDLITVRKPQCKLKFIASPSLSEFCWPYLPRQHQDKRVFEVETYGNTPEISITMWLSNLITLLIEIEVANRFIIKLWRRYRRIYSSPAGTANLNCKWRLVKMLDSARSEFSP